jgi:outer membrane protein TolC
MPRIPKDFNMPLKIIQSASGRISISILVSLGLCGNYAAWGQVGVAQTLSLSQAIDLALKQNRNLKLAQLGVVDSEHKKEIARAAYFPNIKNESSLLHVTELAGVDIPAGAFGAPSATGPLPANTLFIGQGSLTAYTSGTGLTQPLSQMFKIRESNRAAIADLNTARIQVNETENDIALKVRQLYYGILIAQSRLRAATEEANASQLNAQESVDAAAQGRALDVTVLESRAAVLDAKQSALTQNLQIHDLMLSLDDLLGLPLNSQLQLEDAIDAAPVSTPSREECIHIAHEQSPEIRKAQQAVIKAKAGLGAAKDAYIPDVTGLARYHYQSGVPLLVHNFGTFGFNVSYELFDGGRREGEIKDSRTLLSQAELNLAEVEDQTAVQVETAFDKVEQLKGMLGVAEEALAVRTEAARLSDRQFEQNAALASARAEAHAREASAKASLLETNLNLFLAQSDLKRAIGQLPR